MFQIDKEKFGAFVAQLRKEKGLTQKELAEKLFLSDKAVSKWERGLSMPDIAILAPLADALEVSVAELLNCQRMPMESIPPEQVDELVKKAINLSEEEIVSPWKRWKHWAIFSSSWVLAAAEWKMLLYMNYDKQLMMAEIGIFLLLSLIFGFYFWFIVQEKLPRYYDEYEIRYYYYNGLKMNIPGVRLNNSNWPHVLRTARWWCIYYPISVPLLYGLICHVELQTGVGIDLGGNLSMHVLVLLLWTLITLFVPLVCVGKKYQ